jgi:hypothetical protein
MSESRLKLTPVRIRRHKWWWRLSDNCFEIQENGTTKKRDDKDRKLSGFEKVYGSLIKARWQWWKDGREIAAFRYELARRLDRKGMILSWPELKDMQSIMEKFLSESTIPWPISIGNHMIDDPLPGNTEKAVFNLQCSDSMLEQSFRDFIAEQRILTGIKHPKIIRKNSVSWKWLEVWDMNEIEGIPLNRSMHAMKSRAIKSAKQFKATVEKAMKLKDSGKISYRL